MKNTSTTPFLLTLAGITLFLSCTSAAIIEQDTNDPFNTSSFNSAGKWKNGLAPSGDNDYETTKILRTPANGADHTFQGKSLTLRGASTLSFKGTSQTAILTVNDLRLRSGSTVTNQSTVGITLAGNISIDSGNEGNFSIDGNNAGFVVSSLVSGAGGIKITTTNRTAQSTEKVIFSNTKNSYSGGTSIGPYAWLVAEGSLGIGDVRLTGGKLSLQSSSAANFIGDDAKLIVSSGLVSNSIVLDFVGTDIVGGISLDGGTTFLSSGIYTVQKLNEIYGSAVFNGSGQLNIGGAIPEPSTVALLIGVGCLLTAFIRRNK